jgi:hypothetical protein
MSLPVIMRPLAEADVLGIFGNLDVTPARVLDC